MGERERLMTKKLSYRMSNRVGLLNPDIPAETKIWRYLDLGKLYILMETSCLYFARVDSLKVQLEGAPTVDEVAAVEAVLDNHSDFLAD